MLPVHDMNGEDSCSVSRGADEVVRPVRFVKTWGERDAVFSDKAEGLFVDG